MHPSTQPSTQVSRQLSGKAQLGCRHGSSTQVSVTQGSADDFQSGSSGQPAYAGLPTDATRASVAVDCQRFITLSSFLGRIVLVICLLGCAGLTIRSSTLTVDRASYARRVFGRGVTQEGTTGGAVITTCFPVSRHVRGPACRVSFPGPILIPWPPALSFHSYRRDSSLPSASAGQQTEPLQPLRVPHRNGSGRTAYVSCRNRRTSHTSTMLFLSPPDLPGANW